MIHIIIISEKIFEVYDTNNNDIMKNCKTEITHMIYLENKTSWAQIADQFILLTSMIPRFLK